MVKLQSYKDLCQKQENLLNKGYCFNSLGLVTLATKAGGALFKARVAQQADSTVDASTSITVKHNDVTFIPKKWTNGMSRYTLMFAPEKDLILKADCTVDRKNAVQSYNTVIVGAYTQPEYKFTLGITEPQLGVLASATIGKPEYGVALDGKMDFGLQRLVRYNFALYWFQKQHRLVVKHMGYDQTQLALGNFVLSYFQKMSKETQVGANITLNYPKKETIIEFGGKHAMSEDLSLKAKVDSNGFLSGAVTRKFNENVSATLATQINAKKVADSNVSDYKLGIRLDLSN